MARREMGRYWSSEEGRQVSTLRSSEGSSKRKYPKCVPLAKATRMTKSQKASAVRRKRAVSNKGPKPTNVKTFAKDGGMIKQAQQNYSGSYISGDLGGVECW